MNFAARLGYLSDFVTTHMVHSLGSSNTTGLLPNQLGVIRKAQFDAIISTSRPMMFANLANAAAVLLIQISQDSLWFSTLLWSIVVGSFAVSGLRSAYRYRRAAHKDYAGKRAPGKVTLSAVILALVWCYPVLFILPIGTAVEIAFVSALTAGMVAGGALALYPVPLAGLLYTSILSSISFIVIVFSGKLPALPFAIVIIAFALVVIHSVLRQSGMFLSELVGKLEAQRKRDSAKQLIDTYQGKGGQYLWRCDPAMDLTTDPIPLLEMLGLPISGTSQSNLLDVLKLAGAKPLLSGNEQMPMERVFPKNYQVDLTLQLADGRTVRFVGRPEKLNSMMPRSYLGYLKDITVETNAADEIHRLATRDTMTGLLDYREFRKQAEAILASDIESKTCIVYLFVDADGLKAVNDNYGHASGDLMILDVASRLKKHLPEGSLVSRKGGDEFVALFQTADLSGLQRWASGFLANICGNLEREDLRIPVSCCVGISYAVPEDLNLSDLELEADRALYDAKSRGKQQVQIYNDAIGREIRRDRILARDLEIALDHNELTIEFQPIFGGIEAAIVGVEVLLRWKHPIYGHVPPQTVVSIAQVEGLSMALFNFVLNSAISHVQDLPVYGFLSVNVMSADLQRHDLATQVINSLARSNFPPTRLWLEVTESEALRQIDEVRNNLHELRAHGIKIAIDDFGSGYSSLSSVGEIPADIIKIDRLLIKDCNQSQGNQIILRTVKSLAEVYGLEVVAEGAETPEEVSFLVNEGFGMIQGFALGRPMSGRTFSKLLLERSQDYGIAASIKVVA